MPLHVMVAIFVLHFCGAKRITDPLIEVGGITNYCYPGENPQCVEGGGKNTIASECPSDAGKMQSGVDIPYAPEDKFKFIELAATEAYSEARSFAIGNNGHTVQLRMHKGDDFLIGGPLVKNIAYTLDSIHFHWSSSSKGDTGNEHHIFGKSNFPLEIHLVHYKKKFGNLREAIKSKEADALVVIAVPYRVDTNGNEYLVPVIKYLKDVTKFKQTTNGEGLVVRELFVPEIFQFKHFFMARYQGSLTTPTCDQVVRWLVLTETFPIGRNQGAFRYYVNKRVGGSGPKLMTSDDVVDGSLFGMMT